MINIKILYDLLFIFFTIELISCEKKNINIQNFMNFTDNYTSNTDYIENGMSNFNDNCSTRNISYYNTPENIYFSNIKNIIYNNENYTFHNYPRKNKNGNWPTFTKYNNITKCFDPWPNEKNKDSFSSVINFEFDQENNIYILDEGNSVCPNITITKFNISGFYLGQYKIDDNNSNKNLSDFVIDTINNYIYITYSTDNKYGIYVKDMNNTDNAKKVIIDYDELKIDDNYIISKIINEYFENVAKRVINIALSCDSKVLFLSPLSSRKIFSISTETIRTMNNNETITKDQVNEAFKNDFSSSIVAGNLGNLYFTGLENKNFYRAGQFDNKLTEFDYKGLNQGNNSLLTEEGFLPLKLSINNGSLYIYYKDLLNVIKSNKLTTKIYNATIDKENSYVYKCAGLNYKWNIISYTIWGVFAFILCFIVIFVLIENRQDKDYDYKKNNEEQQILKKKS